MTTSKDEYSNLEIEGVKALAIESQKIKAEVNEFWTLSVLEVFPFF